MIYEDHHHRLAYERVQQIIATQREFVEPILVEFQFFSKKKNFGGFCLPMDRVDNSGLGFLKLPDSQAKARAIYNVKFLEGVPQACLSCWTQLATLPMGMLVKQYVKKTLAII